MPQEALGSRKAVVGEETDKPVNSVRGNKPHEKEQWVVKSTNTVKPSVTTSLSN